MKKVLLILTFLATRVLLFGQDSCTTIGIIMNPGIATIYNPLVKNLNYSRFSTSAGLEIKHSLYKNKIYIESRLDFIDRGFKVNQHIFDIYGNDLGLVKSKEIEYYLSLPIIVSYKFKGIIIGVGPYINYYLARRYIVNGKLISTDKNYQHKNILFGVQCYLGYEMRLSNNLLLSFDGYVNPTFSIDFINYGLGIGLKYVLD
jgi:hypothetical protein